MTESAFVARCGWCEQGLVRLYRCNACEEVSAICDECERIWRDPSTIHSDPRAKSNGSHPNCPHCPNGDVTWTRLDDAEISRSGLRDLVIGHSH